MPRLKDPAEIIAEMHLKSRFNDVIYEPYGNVYPDFLVNGRIAVEARRLNQNVVSKGKLQGLEESSIPLPKRIRDILEKMNDPFGKHSWNCSIKAKRPFPAQEEIEKKILKTNCSV